MNSAPNAPPYEAWTMGILASKKQLLKIFSFDNSSKKRGSVREKLPSMLT